MNILDILFLCVLGFYFISGAYRGLITSGLSTLGFVGSWIAAQKFYPILSNAAMSNRTLMAVISQYLEADSFFNTLQEAATKVASVVAGGETAITRMVNALPSSLDWVKDAFELNVRSQRFSSLGIETLSEYLDQSIIAAVFNILSFLVIFILFYVFICLFVNLLDRVIRWPVLRGFDSVLGGILGLVRGMVVCTILLFIVPLIVSVFSSELSQQLIDTSKLYRIISTLDTMRIRTLLNALIQG